MVARENDTGMGLFTRGQSCAPRAILAMKLQPANQVPHGTANGSGSGGGIEWLQVETTRGHHADVRLGLHLKQFVVTSE
jgi:hypothetical protein